MFKKIQIKNINEKNQNKTVKKTRKFKNVLNLDQCQEKLFVNEEIKSEDYLTDTKIKEADFCLLEDSPFYIHRVRN